MRKMTCETDYFPAVKAVLAENQINFMTRQLGSNRLIFCGGVDGQRFNLRLMDGQQLMIWAVFSGSDEMAETLELMNKLNNIHHHIRFCEDRELGICAIYDLNLTGSMESAAESIQSNIGAFLEELEVCEHELNVCRTVSCVN